MDSTCNNWSPSTASPALTAYVALGSVSLADSQFFRTSAGNKCGSASTQLVYCVEQ